jgi:membrane-associated phospholipid phosphatase
VLAVVAAAGTARAEGDGPYDVRWAIDLPLVAAGVALWVLPVVVLDEVVDPSCSCRRDRVSGLDSFALDRHSSFAKTASDILVTSLAIAPLGLDALDVYRSEASWRGFAGDVAVMSEALVVSGALNGVLKLSVRRPRPLLYDAPPGSPARADPDNYISFYSAHTSTSFAVTLAYATTFALRHPDSPARFWFYGGAVVLSGTVGLLRVLAGKHFPTDVLAGAAVGTAVGMVIPRLHLRSREVMALPVEGGAVLVLGGRL